MTFIKLTGYDDGDVILINLDLVRYVSDIDGHATLFFTDVDYEEVKQPIEYIMDVIKSMQKDWPKA